MFIQLNSNNLPMFHYQEGTDDLFPGEQGSAGVGEDLSLVKAPLHLVESQSLPLILWKCSTRYKTSSVMVAAASVMAAWYPGVSRLRIRPPLPGPHTQDWRPCGALCCTFGFGLYETRCRIQHNLPSNIRGSDSTTQGGAYTQLFGGRALFTASDMFSSYSSSSLTTLLNEPVAHHVFTLSCQLNDLLLASALKLQQLENSQTMAASCTMQDVWENKPWSL
uniref:Uncharacterized protein n=1 Tax=Oncorhynchus kisutch TaxID=8019 RepID=A0A8C7MYA0_ONCKI